LQEDKSGGGIGILGGSSQSFFGASSGNILAKFTSILLVVFLLSCVIIAIIASRTTTEITATRGDLDKAQQSRLEAKITELNPDEILTNDETSDEK
jgi:preprotein translocase subunit SecG